MLFDQLERVLRRHVRHEPHVDLRRRAVGQDRLAAWAGVAADESFDVDRGLRDEPDERVVPRLVAVPLRNAQRFLGGGFVAARNRLLEDLLELWTKRADLVEEALDRRRVTVGADERMQRLDEM